MNAGEVGLRYLMTSAKVRRAVDEHMAGSGVSLARTKILQVLVGLGPVKQTRLATELGMAARSITQAVEAMERDGLVRRSSDAADKRAKVVTATDEGVRALTAGEESGAEVLRTIFERLSPEQVKALDEILDVLA
ncbi:MarR family winged helix-turn-helix transcriptional regulator [Lentzea flaviverrucosa]|uniref:DNA-binding transcriptional regulator, MarR family n=1 Tax=Lentzea flaviverrucosa TaxID=200379 RepID=A0A1H9CXV5_9PSEU|nr:MarR family winged helix-turn-helix transcriptional regulator [Lentzea flaviverrucosa]RDI24679.1 DNA-binding MarR family transcriptional regulator [Lentzea flaviverrucosa]SEQ05947.1 DNA-binding transcriptional regulator, MarR family [Lentzea flaviverrucosa]